MTTYLPDAAMIALGDFIADNADLCRALDLLPCPLAGMVENYQVEFELGARLDLWRERAQPVIEAGMLEMAVGEALTSCLTPVAVASNATGTKC